MEFQCTNSNRSEKKIPLLYKNCLVEILDISLRSALSTSPVIYCPLTLTTIFSCSRTPDYLYAWEWRRTSPALASRLQSKFNRDILFRLLCNIASFWCSLICLKVILRVRDVCVNRIHRRISGCFALVGSLRSINDENYSPFSLSHPTHNLSLST